MNTRDLPSTAVAGLTETRRSSNGAGQPFWWLLARLVAINTGIAAFLWLTRFSDNFSHLLVASQSVGLLIFAADRAIAYWVPRGRNRAWLHAGGIVLGALLGTLLTVELCGTSMFGGGLLTAETGRMVLAGLAFGGGISYFFYSRGCIASAQAAWQQRETMKVTSEKQVLDARLRLLQAQIEPHFLFNTLANVQCLIQSDPPRARLMLDRLIGYMRATLDRTRAGTTTLGGEFDLIESYLTILGIRMGKRLTYRIDLPAALREHPLPPMLLQPLVENAIKHGLEPKIDGGLVEICAERRGARLHLRVADTGLGFGKAKTTSGSGFGLGSVRERLDAVFGAEASFQVAANAPSGVVIDISLPLDAAHAHSNHCR
jgi:sensor histidine kinase YesM